MNKPGIILIFANLNWGFGWSSRKRISYGLLDCKWDVIYSSGQQTIWELINEKKLTPFNRGFKYSDGIIVDCPGTRHFSWPTKYQINKFQSHSFAKSLKRDIYDKFGDANILTICFHPSFLPIVEELNPHKLIYFVYDDHALSPGWNRQLEEQEKRLLHKTDLVIGFSPFMLERLRGEANIPFKVMNLGVDFNFFNQAIDSIIPQDLKEIPRPRIGWVGNINKKIDFELVKNIANAKPDYHWVFIGRQTGDDKLQEWKDCLKLTNIHFLGLKDHDLIPTYLANMDVNVMPYNIYAGLWVNHGYPLKMHEYLAVGKPVVSANLAAVKPFNKVIDICEGVEDWIATLAKRIDNDDPALPGKRIEAAKSYDWKSLIGKLDNWLLSL